MNTTAKIFLGFALGAVFGGATALMMAPSTGRTTRKNLNRKAKKLVKQIETFVGKETNKRKTTGSATSKNGKAPVAVH